MPLLTRSTPLRDTGELHVCPQAGGLEELPEWKADHSTLSAGSVDQGSGSLLSTVPNQGSQTHRTQPLGQEYGDSGRYSTGRSFLQTCVVLLYRHFLYVHSCSILAHSCIFFEVAIEQDA